MPFAPSPSRDRRAVPPAPLLLGLAGLLPFWGLAIAIPFAPMFGLAEERIATVLAAYAAVIASFLGGIRWGLATVAETRAAPREFAVAVVPSLLAWAVLSQPAAKAVALLGFMLLVLGPLDARLVADGLAPPWFRRLRLILSGGAGAALLLAAAAMAWRG